MNMWVRVCLLPTFQCIVYMGRQKLFDLISCHDQEGNICSTDPNSFGINFNFDDVVQRRPCTVYQTSFDSSFSSSSSSCSLRVMCFPCSLVLKVELVPPSLLRLSNVPSSFCSVFQCLSWRFISVRPLYVL